MTEVIGRTFYSNALCDFFRLDPFTEGLTRKVK